jgi:uncharacterized protein
MRILWFDRWLKGIHNGIDQGPRALIYVPGPNQWRYEADWPIPDTKRTRLYLSAEKSGSAQSLNDGSLTATPPKADAAPEAYAYAPGDAAGPATLFANQQGQEAGSNAVDQRPFEATRMTWTTAALKVPTEVTGTVALDFWASSTIGDPDFAVRLVDVAPDGSAIQVARGWLSAAHYPSDSHPKPLAAGEKRHLRVQVWPTSNIFAAGHRIRIDLSGSDFPLMELNPNGHTDTIYHDAAHPSAVILPVIGAPAP